MPLPIRLSRRAIAGALLATGLAAGAVSIWFATRPGHPSAPEPEARPQPDPPTPDPRLVFDTPFRNVKPDVGYVGDEVCARCHRSIADSYHAHPMGRSAALVSKGKTVEKYDPSGHTRFASGPFELEVDTTGERVLHRIELRGGAPVAVPAVTIPVEVAIGSGTRGRSYLSVESGAVWQTPLSWFGPDQKWDVSPGFRLGDTVRRSIVPECLYCHVDRVEPIAGAENRYREPLFAKQAAIGCERCHGPGELHAAERTSGGLLTGLDTSIVSPRHLTPTLQLAICEQCHLQGEERINRRGRDMFEYRPGLPFEQFVSAFVRHSDIAAPNKSVGQFEQMEQSRCFTASGGRLLCTSCHDPHRAPRPDERDRHYRARCLNCHETKGCSLPEPDRRQKNDSCIACHMPKAASANIIHASVTDHQIPRRPAARPRPRGLPVGIAPLVRFRKGPLSPAETELDRDLGIALSRFAKKPQVKELAGLSDFSMLAVGRLRTSLERWPGDAPAWGALAGALNGRGQESEKYRAAANAAALAPDSTAAVAALVEAAAAAGEFDAAEEAAGRYIELNPNALHPLASRAFVYISRGDWSKAEVDCLAALRVQPLHPESRLYLAICLHKRGDAGGGQREAQTAARLESDPRQRAYLLDWYRRATR
jgi:predicted CXXCH cytochrome family protein